MVDIRHNSIQKKSENWNDDEDEKQVKWRNVLIIPGLMNV